LAESPDLATLLDTTSEARIGPPTSLSRARELDAIARFVEAVSMAPAALVLAGPAGREEESR
jgi:hypothetical protein